MDNPGILQVWGISKNALLPGAFVVRPFSCFCIFHNRRKIQNTVKASLLGCGTKWQFLEVPSIGFRYFLTSLILCFATVSIVWPT